MRFPPRLATHLDVLSQGLDDGNDLGAVLGVLVDDIRESVPSYLGLQVRAGTGRAVVTVSTLDTPRTGSVRSSVLLPLDLMIGSDLPIEMVAYASAPGGFAELAAAARSRYQLGGEVVLDQHLTPATTAGVAGLAELRTVNQAIGVLIGRGHTAAAARSEILRRALRDGHTEVDAAHQVLASLPGGHPT